jgi:hypothetical protein
MRHPQGPEKHHLPGSPQHVAVHHIVLHPRPDRLDTFEEPLAPSSTQPGTHFAPTLSKFRASPQDSTASLPPALSTCDASVQEVLILEKD